MKITPNQFPLSFRLHDGHVLPGARDLRSRRLLSAIVALLALAIASCVSVPPRPGEDVLFFTKEGFDRATKDLALNRINELFDHLQVPAWGARYPHLVRVAAVGD